METEKRSAALNAVMYRNILSNGLACYIIPREGYVEKHALVCVNYGSVDGVFELDGKTVQTPDGVAHFLEHKLFEDENRSVFDEFAGLGASVNAFTNYLNTAYYFTCTEHFEECLALLLSFTQSLHVTDENVEKEKSVIAQEINMYDDDPFWRMTLNMQDAMYDRCPVKKNIAGSAASIAGIHKEMLRQCFDAFYFPGNMTLVCAGDFRRERVYELAERVAQPRAERKLGRVYGEEPSGVKCRRAEVRMPLARPMFSVGFKEDAGLTANGAGERIVHTKLLMDIAAGISSGLFHRLYDGGLLDGPLALEYLNGPFFGAAVFSGSGPDPDNLADKLITELAALAQPGIGSERFNQIKNKHLGRLARSFNSLDSITAGQADLSAKGLDLFDLISLYENASEERVTERLRQMFTGDNHVISVVFPEEK